MISASLSWNISCWCNYFRFRFSPRCYQCHVLFWLQCFSPWFCALRSSLFRLRISNDEKSFPKRFISHQNSLPRAVDGKWFSFHHAVFSTGSLRNILMDFKVLICFKCWWFWNIWLGLKGGKDFWEKINAWKVNHLAKIEKYSTQNSLINREAFCIFLFDD